MLAFAQLFGVLLFLVLKGRPHFLAHFLGYIAPVPLSLFFIWLVYLVRYYQAHPDDRDGGQLFGALGLMVLSVFVQLVFGALTQNALHSKMGVCAKK